jgi:hypothetical protein
MFIEIDEDGKITPAATPITEREVRARLRRERAADPTIKAAVLDAREREVAWKPEAMLYRSGCGQRHAGGTAASSSVTRARDHLVVSVPHEAQSRCLDPFCHKIEREIERIGDSFA